MNTDSRYFGRSCFRQALAVAALFICTSIRPASAVEIVAHRGGYRLYPENTCVGFHARSGQVDRIEFDVRTSADGELVLMHDETVNRTTTGYEAFTNENGVVLTNVADLTLAQLKSLDAGSKFSAAFTGERIPTFAEALRALPTGIPAMIHMKACSATGIVNVLRAENALSNVIVYCDSWNFLYDVHAIDPDIALCAGGSNAGCGELTTARLEHRKQEGIFNIGWDVNDVTQELVDRIHSCGMKIFMAPPSSLEIQTYVDMGVDGIFLDDPTLEKIMIRGTPSTNVQLARDLVAYWKFDDGLLDPATTNVTDVESSSSGWLYGFDDPPAWLSGDEAPAGGALLLDGLNDYVRIPTNEVLNIGTNSVSISLWVKFPARPSALPNGYACIYGADIDSYTIYLDKAAKELRFKITDASLQVSRPGIPEAKLTTGVWHHVVGVYNGSASPFAGENLIYLDGELQDVHVGADSTLNLGMTNNVRPGQVAAIGRKSAQAGYYYAGAVDDIAIWRRALLPAEVRQIYEAGTNGIPLEKKVMTVWITDIYPILGTSDMHVDARIEHATLTNQTLRIRKATVVHENFVEQEDVREDHETHNHAGMRSHNAPTDGFRFPSSRDPDGILILQLACP